MPTSTWPVQLDGPADCVLENEFGSGGPLPTASLHLGISQREVVMDLYDQVHPVLLAYLRSLGLASEDAEDVANESFMRLMKHLTESRRNENLRGWLFRVAYNLSMDVHRANKRYCYAASAETADAMFEIYEAVDPCPSPEVELIEKESFSRLRSAVMLLTLQQRKCILLRAEGLRYREIAVTLGISLQRAATLLERGATRLKAAL